MPFGDSSIRGSWHAFLNNMREEANKANRRKGEKPQDHPPASFLVNKFMTQLHDTGRTTGKGLPLIDTTTQTVAHYLPCIRPDYELRPLMISSMALETHHRGSRAILRILTPPKRPSMVIAIVEDEEGTAALLELYNQPEESKVGENFLRVGDICIIKEPFFKQLVPDHNDYVLRVDHISDVIWLQDSDSRIPLKWKRRVEYPDETSQDIRLRGNVAVQTRNWVEAERLYTNAIITATTPEEEQLAHLNRSLCNLHLDRPDKALDDACKGNPTEGLPREKALFREAKALYSLRNFDSCLEKLMILVRSNPTNPDAWTEIKRVQQRLNEQKTGSYMFRDMYKQAKETPPLLDCATYVGSVGVRDSPGRGKGLFTTKQVKAGELLLCEKAFAYSYAGNDSPVGRSNTKITVQEDFESFYIGGQANLNCQIVQKLYHNHAGSEAFASLDHGDYTPATVSEVDGTSVVDTFLVSKICEINGFSAPRTSYAAGIAMALGTLSGEDGSDVYKSCGVWLLASRFNHSCVGNCFRSFIGDMLIVRACADIEVGTELHLEYRSPKPYENFQETQKDLMKSWGFTCDCALCLSKKSTSPEIFQKRKDLKKRLDQLPVLTGSATHRAQAKQIVDIMKQTYTTGLDTQLLPHKELWAPYFWLGEGFIDAGKPIEGMKMLVEALEAVGFVIEASYPGGAAGKTTKKKTTLEIKRWGATSELTVDAFLLMLRPSSTLAPELRDVVKEYARVAYRVSHGEDETLNKLYPNFTYRGSLRPPEGIDDSW
ncbi:hypothetical protein F5Y04DRAFT_290376 [Hypomontagnella monticulosa]|nr:hypothetical protein F5Y04DRAFT_290376 [Hypomontagnella monticulosa]